MTDYEAARLATAKATLAAFERIAAALEAAIVPPPEPIGCPHPIEQRMDFGITDGVEDWQCRVCGYRTTTAEAKVI